MGSRDVSDDDTPDTAVLTAPRGQRRVASGKKVSVHHAASGLPGLFDVTVEDVDGTGIFKEYNLNDPDVRRFLRGVDAGVFPEYLELPPRWLV